MYTYMYMFITRMFSGTKIFFWRFFLPLYVAIGIRVVFDIDFFNNFDTASNYDLWQLMTQSFDLCSFILVDH